MVCNERLAPHPGASGLGAVRLSERERETLMVLAEGCTAREAAARLRCSERTVTFHLTNIREKLRADNKAWFSAPAPLA